MPVKPHEAEVIRLPRGTIYIGKRPEKTMSTPETAVTHDHQVNQATPAVSTPEKSEVQLMADEVRECRGALARLQTKQEPFFIQRADELDRVIKSVAEVGIYFDPVSEDDLRQISEAIAYEDDFHDPHWYEIRGSNSYRTLACIEIGAEYHVHYFKAAPRRWFPKFWKITWQVWHYAKDETRWETSTELLKHIVQKHLK